MRYSRTIAIGAAMLSALAVAGTAQAGVAEAYDGRDHVVFEDVLTEQLTDRAGRPLGPKVRVHAAPARNLAGVLSARRGTGGTRTLQAASGCKTVWATRIGRSFLFRTTLWKFTQEKNFCWSYPRLTSVKTNAYPCCTDPTWFYRGLIGSSGWFFSWGGSSSGGHYTFRQGEFEQEVLGKTIDSEHPWIKIRAYGNGSWAYETGT